MAYVFGDRREQSCRRLCEKVPEDYQQVLCYTNCWQSYQRVVLEAQHAPVGKESGEPTQVERWNLTLRQRRGRFVRKTLSFSTCDPMHEICLRLFLHQYNLDRL